MSVWTFCEKKKIQKDDKMFDSKKKNHIFNSFVTFENYIFTKTLSKYILIICHIYAHTHCLQIIYDIPVFDISFLINVYVNA